MVKNIIASDIGSFIGRLTEMILNPPNIKQALSNISPLLKPSMEGEWSDTQPNGTD